MSIPHFQEEGRQNPVTPGSHLPPEVYSQSLDYLVIACVDIVFTCDRHILLAKRHHYPRKSWWIVGGRMTAGEAPLEAVGRKASQEAGLDNLQPDRFRYIGTYSTCFAQRTQPPSAHGLHSLNITYQLELTPPEHQRLTLHPGEYATWQWVRVDEVMSLVGDNGVLDRALLTVIHDLELMSPGH